MLFMFLHHVFLQIPPFNKPFPTNIANNVKILIVSFHVNNHITALQEIFLTNITLIFLHSNVGFHVFLCNNFISETFTTFCADHRLFM